MDIKFIGTGGAFNVDYGNSAALIYLETHTILLDCGHATFPTLVKKNVVDEVDAVLITHLHDDHVGSLSSLLLYHQLVLQKGRLKLIYPDDNFKSLLLSFLRFSLGEQVEERVHLVPITDFPALRSINTNSKHVAEMPSWAYGFVEKDQALLYSGDIGDPDHLFRAIANMELPEQLTIFHEVAFQASNAHTYYKDLESYLGRFQIFGYHLDPRTVPADNRIPLVIEQADFLL